MVAGALGAAARELIFNRASLVGLPGDVVNGRGNQHVKPRRICVAHQMRENRVVHACKLGHLVDGNAPPSTDLIALTAWPSTGVQAAQSKPTTIYDV